MLRIYRILSGDVLSYSMDSPSNNVDERLAKVTFELAQIVNPGIPLYLEQQLEDFVSIRQRLAECVKRLDARNGEVCQLRGLMQTAAVEEAHAQRRLQYDMQSLQAEAAELAIHLDYIKKERDILKLRQISDCPNAPLLEVLESQPAGTNQVWQSLIANAKYAPLSYN